MQKILNILPVITAMTGIGAISAAAVNNKITEKEDVSPPKNSVTNPLDVMAKSPQTLSAQAQVIDSSKKEAEKSLGPDDFDSFIDFHNYVMSDESLTFQQKMEKLNTWKMNDFRETDWDDYDFNENLTPDETPLTQNEIEAVSKIITHPDLNYIFHRMTGGYNDEDITRYTANVVTDIQSKYDSLEDDIIKGYVDKTLALARKDEDNRIELVDQANNVLDAYHQLNGNMSGYTYNGLYAPLFDYIEPVRVLRKIQKDKSIKSRFRKNIENPDAGDPMSYIAQDFIDKQKTHAMESVNDKSILNYLYTNYYVPKLNKSPEVKKLLNKINQETGCKIIISSYSKNTLEELELVYEELSDWKKISKGEAKFPPIINFSLIKEKFINGRADGLANRNVYVNGQRLNTIRSVLRHELIHVFDTKKEETFNSSREVRNLINSIMPAKEVIVDGRKQKVLDFDNCKYREELLCAGIEPSDIEYAYTNRAEFIAVAGTGDCSKYSDEFKEVLIKLGMPEYALEMPCLDPEVIDRMVVAEEMFESYEGKKLPGYSDLVDELDDLVAEFKESQAFIESLFKKCRSGKA